MREAALRRPDIRVLEGFELVDLITCGNRAGGVLLESRMGRGSRCSLHSRCSRPAALAHVSTGRPIPRLRGARGSRPPRAAACVSPTSNSCSSTRPHSLPTPIPFPCLPRRFEAPVPCCWTIPASGSCGRHLDAELAPRDVVARRVAALHAAGQAVWPMLPASPTLSSLPGRLCARQARWADAGRQPLPVVTAAHFHMGGIATDDAGRTSLAGLWACGEVAASGLHGGNRLASNSLLEGLVFGKRIARALEAEDVAHAARPARDSPPPDRRANPTPHASLHCGN